MRDLEVGEVDNICQRCIAHKQSSKAWLSQQQAPCHMRRIWLQQGDSWQSQRGCYGRHQAQQIHAVQLLALVRQQHTLQGEGAMVLYSQAQDRRILTGVLSPDGSPGRFRLKHSWGFDLCSSHVQFWAKG